MCEKMSSYFHLKILVKRRLSAIPRALCEECCLDIEHTCEVEEYHLLYHFDDVFSRRSSAQQYRLRILEELLMEIVLFVGLRSSFLIM